MKKKIFLSGASGFIGKNILEKLKDDYAFYAPTHRQLDLLDFNSVNSYFQKNGPFDLVLHTAIIGGNRMTGDGEAYAVKSMRMFFNLAACEKYFKRFFYFGSGIEYGKEKPIKKFGEDYFSRCVPQSNWGLFKYICAKYIEDRPKYINLRIFGVFGKWEDYRIRFISNSICKNILKTPITINKNIKMDYIYIDDLISIIERFINKKLTYNAYNVTPTASTDLITIAKMINTVSANKVQIKINHKGNSPEYTGNNERLLKELPDFKFTKMADAIEELYRWYLNNINLISKKELEKDYF